MYYFIYKDTDRAVSFYKKVIKLAPGEYQPYYKIGLIYLREVKDRDRACYYLAAAADRCANKKLSREMLDLTK